MVLSICLFISALVTTENLDKPKISRVALTDTPARSISVGYPNKFNAVIDSVKFTPLYVWTGDFLNFQGELRGRGGNQCSTNGARVKLNLPEFPLRIHSTESLPNELIFKGYRRIKNNTPIFYAKLDGYLVSQTITSEQRDKVTLSYNFFEHRKKEAYFLTGQIDRETISLSEEISWKGHHIVIPQHVRSFQITLDVSNNKRIGPSKQKVTGKDIYQLYCAACHSTTGHKLIGPSFKDIMGKKEVVLINGEESTITVDEAYLKSSIISPQKEILAEYKAVLMPSFKDILKKEELDLVIQYIKTLSK